MKALILIPVVELTTGLLYQNLRLSQNLHETNLIGGLLSVKPLFVKPTRQLVLVICSSSVGQFYNQRIRNVQKDEIPVPGKKCSAGVP